jgi:uncharacterized membrane protein
MSISKWLNESGYKTVKSVELGGKIPDLIAYNNHEIVAFEEKKNAEEIQNAIGQCLHYLEEANKAFIVLPSEETNKLPGKTLKVIKKYGIGLLSKGKDITIMINAKHFGNPKKEILEKIKRREDSLKEKSKNPKKSIRFSGINEDDILKILEKHPEGIKINEMARILKAPRQTISKYVYALKIAGFVDYREFGRSKICFLIKKMKGKKVLT